MLKVDAAIQAQNESVFEVECFGFRGRGGFTVTISESMQRSTLLDNLYATKEYQSQNSRPHHPWAENAPLPAVVPAGTWTFGYRLTDDPWEHGGTGEGEYYCERA